MSKKIKTGYCKLCGNINKLSFEHTPPKAAFNDKPVISYKLEDVINLGPGEIPNSKYNQSQRGMGEYSLCEKCNNDTGAWYGKHFIEWCYQGMDILIKSNGNPKLIYLHYLFPLAIIKQIISILICSAHRGFTNAHTYLRYFLLNKEKRYLPERYHIYVYFYCSGVFRNTGLIIEGRINGKMIPQIEFTYPPFGYVLTIDELHPDKRLTEITHFSNYGYKDFKVQTLEISSLPTHLGLPGDYRSKKEILNDSKQ